MQPPCAKVSEKINPFENFKRNWTRLTAARISTVTSTAHGARPRVFIDGVDAHNIPYPPVAKARYPRGVRSVANGYPIFKRAPPRPRRTQLLYPPRPPASTHASPRRRKHRQARQPESRTTHAHTHPRPLIPPIEPASPSRPPAANLRTRWRPPTPRRRPPPSPRRPASLRRAS